jgi:sugar O-acyltransferase (sialic acid O-acetyltransferase NeuD family)
MSLKKIIIFGTGDIAQLANYYFTFDSDFEVVAFTVDRDYINETTFEDLPLVPFDEIENHFDVEECFVFIALSYAQMNNLRAQKYLESKNKGYKIASYISSKCSYLSQFEPGENAFILEDNTIQPFVKIGTNVTLWSGNHIGHHSIIHDNTFVSSHVVISGHCTIEKNCFLGVNATIGHQVTIGEESLIGAGSIITKSTNKGDVYVPTRSVLLDKKSNMLKL